MAHSDGLLRAAVDSEVLERAVQDHPIEAADALAAIQSDLLARLTVPALELAAETTGTPLAELWISQLGKMGRLEAFAAALQARGIPLEVGEPPAVPGGPPRADFGDHFPLGLMTEFTARAGAFRCSVLVNGKAAGSGCLVGPSLVLTAWHVVAVQSPAEEQLPAADVSVQLADGSKHPVGMPPRLESRCGDDEYSGRAPRNDNEVEGRHDVAVLMMRRPAAAHLGYVSLPATAAGVTSGEAVLLVHFPDGVDRGLGSGELTKIRRVTARWQHRITSKGGSSGGPLFGTTLQLVGLHQGKWDPTRGRLIPASLFLDDLRDLVAADLAPSVLWSLDGTPTGTLVIGRDLVFETVAAAAAADDAGPVRGLRIKRRDIKAGTSGLAFSAEILRQLLTRRELGHSLIRIGFDDPGADFAGLMTEQAAAAGLPLAALPSPAGVGDGATAPEGAARDRGAVLAAAIGSAATAAGRTVWFFFEDSSGLVSDATRLAFEGFVAAALVQPRLRLVIAGFETIALPGQEFAAPAAAAGAPGFVVEYLGGFTRPDVMNLLTRATRELNGRPAVPAVIENIADRVLGKLQPFNGVYPDSALEEVATELRDDLAEFARKGGVSP